MTDDVGLSVLTNLEYYDLALLVDNNISLRRYNEIRDALEDIEVFILDEETEYDDNNTYLTAQYPDTIPFPKLEKIIEGFNGDVCIDYDAMADWMDDYVEDSE